MPLQRIWDENRESLSPGSPGTRNQRREFAVRTMMRRAFCDTTQLTAPVSSCLCVSLRVISSITLQCRSPGSPDTKNQPLWETHDAAWFLLTLRCIRLNMSTHSARNDFELHASVPQSRK